MQFLMVSEEKVILSEHICQTDDGQTCDRCPEDLKKKQYGLAMYYPLRIREHNGDTKQKLPAQ